MNKEKLLATCHSLIEDIEKELADDDIWDALDDIRQVFVHFKELETQIDILSPKEEEKLDEVISTLAEIDVDRIKSIKEIIYIVDKIQILLGKFKSNIIMGKTEEIIDLVQNIKLLLDTMTKNI